MALHQGVLRKYAIGLSVVLRVSDAMACVVAAVLAYMLRFGSGKVFQFPGYPLLILIGVFLLVIVFPMTGLYGSWRTHRLRAPVARALFAWIIVFVSLLVLLVVFKQTELYSREWMAGWFGLQGAFLLSLRLTVYGSLSELRRRGFNRRDVVVVGSGRQARFLIKQVRRSIRSGFVVIAVFNGAEESGAIGRIHVQPLAELRKFLTTRSVDEIWITLPLEQSEKLRGVLAQLQDSAANVRYMLDFQDLYLLNHGVTDVLGIPMMDLMASPIQGANYVLKLLEDRVLATVILVLISPIMALIAIGVKLSSPGPVFYRQERTGWNGRPFMMLKFRSMRLDAEANTGAVWASKGDARATSFGIFLRRTSLDELPQFLNVLKGDMSIVGPRPERPIFVRKFRSEISNYMPRHLVKAGITGWAQIKGWRGNTDLNKRVEHDLYYIENWSLWFDIKIIFLTLFKGFLNRNAY